MRAGIYVRLSQDRRIEEEGVRRFAMLGVERQRHDCYEMCERLGWEVVNVYVDNDVSATTGKPRPAYEQMLVDIQSGLLEAIVCWHPDRLYRKVTDLKLLTEICNRHKVAVATVNAGIIDLATPTGRLVAGLLAQVAEYEGEHKSERWRRSWRQKRENGIPYQAGTRLFGWDREGVLIPDEVWAIRWAATELLNGTSVRSICTGLSERGVRTTKGNRWTASPLRRMLTNPRMAGWIMSDGEIIARSQWPAILDEETFEAVRALLSARRTNVPPPPRVAVLAGLIYCSGCDDRMETSRRYKHGGSERSYRCRRLQPNKGIGPCVDVAAEPVEVFVETYAQERLSDPRVVEELNRLNETGDGGTAREIVAMEERLVDLEHALDDPEQTSVAEISRAIRRLRDRLTEAQDQLARSQPGNVIVSSLTWPTTVAERNAAISLAVERVVIRPVGVGREFNTDRIAITPTS